MIDDKEKDQIIKSIELRGGVNDAEVSSNPIIINSRKNLNHIASHSSGPLKIYPSIARKFAFILSQPSALSALSPFEIRCVLCKRVISYPCWYYNIKYAVNHFHYFVCFDSESPSIVSTRCYRKD